MNADNEHFEHKKVDLRTRRTYKFLWEALLQLMADRDFEAITVTDICDRAMVHRTTFYKHYEDKYALLAQGIQNQLGLLFDALNLPPGQVAELNEQTDMIDLLVTLFEHVLQQQHFYRLMLVGEGISKFYPLFSKSLVEQFLRRSEMHSNRQNKARLMRHTLRAQAHVGVLVGTIAWWLENDCIYTPAEMGDFLWEDIFSQTIR
jgi:AcrR family transcriptional regulator